MSVPYDLISEVETLNADNQHFKYNEGQILKEIIEYIKSTYGQHYATSVKSVQTFDAIIEMDQGEAWRFFRNCAIKYLWRLGRKNGFNKVDLMKAMHYLVLLMYVLKEKENRS